MSGCLKNQWKAVALAAAALLVGSTAGRAAPETGKIEFLQAALGPQNAGLLSGLACRNLDHIVHLDLTVKWPAQKLGVEQNLGVENGGYRRLVFWNDTDEFLFPNGTYLPLHGGYGVKGYFIPRAGGIHQGIASNYFEKAGVDPAKRTPGLVETKATGRDCK